MKLSALTEEDSGLYTCVAIGAYSDHSDSIELIVESTHSYYMYNNANCVIMVNVYVGPPSITAIKPDYVTVSGSKVTLVCMIVKPGEPRAAFGWTKNGDSIDSIHSVTINDSFVSITIANVTAQDAGIYTCTATGIESYHSDSIKLHVTLNSKGKYICTYFHTFVCCIQECIFNYNQIFCITYTYTVYVACHNYTYVYTYL